jgi:hypothetical protein
VKWFGYDQPSWEPFANMAGDNNMVDLYNEQGAITLDEFSAWLK